MQVYNYFGVEYYDRTAFGAGALGFGSPSLDLAPCTSETGVPCVGANRSIWQTMPGPWCSLAQGEQGSVVLGLSYIHSRRSLWSGLHTLRPQGRESSFVTSVRYYLP